MFIPSRQAMRCAVLAALRGGLGAVSLVALTSASFAQVNLSDDPVLSTTAVPGNLALPLSVEYPTAVSVANIAEYTTARAFLGYFDPRKCYGYNFDVNEANRYFYPTATTTTNTCTGAWSGSFLNWATMQTIDPFRKVLTGGLRTTDTATVTIIEKAWASGQGGTGNFPNRTLAAGVTGATPFGWGEFRMRIQGLENRMRFTGSGNVDAAPTAYNPGAPVNPAVTYEVSVRVRVCNPAAPGGVESNCVQYGSNYKPQGLIQEYSDRIRYSAFGYLNDGNIRRDGGVLRARQKFVGPMEPRPGLPSIANAASEWDAATGVFIVDPDTADSSATGVPNSGVINYLNKFGQSGSYKTYDPVGELYYAAVRYFKNLGNVPEWSQVASASSNAERAQWIDGFPVITTWDDPIQYSCQRNFILGIGDVNTHADKNVPGPTGNANEPTKPAAVLADTTVNATVNAVADTDRIGVMEGLGTLGTTAYPYCCSNNAAFIAGLAYDAHTRDIRPDNPAVPRTVGLQTVTTYWLDVLEYQNYRSRNQYWLATKYGGFRVPPLYSPDTATAALPVASWNTGGELVTGGTDLKPDNYFTATAPEEVEAGLRSAFASIAANLRAFTTSFSTSGSQVTQSGNASYSAQYDSSNWTGAVTASQLDFDAVTANATLTERWSTNTTLANQLAGAGWDTGRRVVTWGGTAGVRFRSGAGGITATQLAALDTPYGAGVDGPQYLNYLRGDRSNEVGVTGALGYRPRVGLLGDIDGSKATAVNAPNSRYADATNPGYSAFVAAYATRTPMVYVGSNDGMLHAFNGALTGATAGSEVFAYVPSALFAGATAPATDGLVSRGDPNFVHRSLVNATAVAFDIDFARTGGPVTGNPTPNWRSILIGGLGKGGRSYYAIDVTDPLGGGTPTEAAMAGRVLWEFPSAGNATHTSAIPRMGFSYGQPLVTKTAKYGWVVILPSGYNSASGGSYLFFLNPNNGNLLETVTVGTVAEPSSGLAHAQWYVRDFSDNTAETVYAGDILGNLWRLDVTAASGAYPTPVNIGRLTSDTGVRQPVTTRPLIEVDPTTGRRFVLVGTGRLLDDTDIASTASQSFYAFIDGTEAQFSTAATLPAGVIFPVTRTSLVPNTDSTLAGTGVTLTAARPMGWYTDLPVGSAGVASRVVLDPVTAFRRVAFATLLPEGDACTPSGTSRIYVVNFGSGESALTSNQSYVSLPGVVIDLRFLSVNGGQARLYAGGRGATSSSAGAGSQPDLRQIELEDPGSTPLRRLNWREVAAPQ